MSASYYSIPVFLIYDAQNDRASWMVPSIAERLMAANPLIERVMPEDPDFIYKAAMAGKKPVKYLRDTSFVDKPKKGIVKS